MKVIQFFEEHWLAVILGITTLFNMVMSFINAAKTGKCVKYSEVVAIPDIMEIVETVRTLSYGEKVEFFSQLQKVLEEENNGVQKK